MSNNNKPKYVSGRNVSNKRKRYIHDLKTGELHDRNGKVAVDENGEAVKLRDPKRCKTKVETARAAGQRAYRAGYVAGVNDSTAAVKTAAGLKANEKLPENVKIKHTAVKIQPKDYVLPSSTEVLTAVNAIEK